MIGDLHQGLDQGERSMDQCKTALKTHLFDLYVGRSDRWQIRRRLAELAILSRCEPEGHLSVAVDKAVDVIQVRSVVQSFLKHPSDLRQGLESCWRLPVATHPKAE